ncbi:hypothetical protein [Paenibacillus taichungensis]
MNLQKFHEVIEKSEIPPAEAIEKEGAMVPLQHVFHIGIRRHQRFSDVDFSKFTYEQAKLAMNEAIFLRTGDNPEDHEEIANRDNLVVQVARIVGFKEVVNGLRSSTNRKRRFV